MANHIQNRGLPGMPSPTVHVYRCLRVRNSRREVNEACRCACPDGIAPSKVGTNDDACDDHILISAKSETLLSRPLSASMLACIRTLPNSKPRTLKSGTLV